VKVNDEIYGACRRHSATLGITLALTQAFVATDLVVRPEM
jgi:hypothetical protein